MSIHSSRPRDRPLNGVRVLVTRAENDGGALSGRLAALGAEVIHLPTIAVTIMAKPDVLTALTQLDRYHWIVFTSRNGVQGVVQFEEAVAGLSRFEGEIAAVGPGTEAELRRHGLRATCVPDGGAAAALLAELVGRGVDGQAVLLPRGDLARDELPAGLRSAGAIVTEVVVYETTIPREQKLAALTAVRRGDVDVIALASPSAWNNLITMLGAGSTALQGPAVACIGPSTAEAVRAFGIQPATIAKQHTLGGLVTAIVELYETNEEPDA